MDKEDDSSEDVEVQIAFFATDGKYERKEELQKAI